MTSQPTTGTGTGSRVADYAELVLLCVDAVLLGLLELFYLPLYIGSVPAPVTVLLAAVTVPLLVRRAGRLFASTPVAAAPVVVWLLTVLVVGLTGPGGDLVLPPDYRALLLIAFGLLPAAVTLGTVGARSAATSKRATRG